MNWPRAAVALVPHRSPNSLNLLPGYEYDGPEPDAFLDTRGLLAYLEGSGYVASVAAPVRSKSPVGEVRPADGGGFLVRTPRSGLHAGHGPGQYASVTRCW